MRSLTLLCGIAMTLAAATAHATTVRRAPVAELARASDVIVHAMVRHVDDELATSRDGPFLTAVELELLAIVKGVPDTQQTLRLILPGGRGFGRVAQVPGMPALEPGDEVVLLLEKTNLSMIFTGMGQGVFRVTREGGEARVARDLAGLNLVGVPRADIDFDPTLPNLMTYLRSTVRTGGQR